MRPINWISRLFAIGSAALWVVSCATIAPPTPTPAPTAALRIMVQPTEESRPGMPAYAAPGPYAVGTAYVSIPVADYKVEFYLSYPLGADGAPNTANGPYPLLLFSEGLGGTDYMSLLSHFASYGFVVMDMVPRDSVKNATGFWAGAANRILDTKLILDTAEKLTAAGGQLPGMIDMQHAAIAGHSSGGWTALVGGGAQMDFGGCIANSDVNFIAYSCPQFKSHQQEIAQKLGLKSAPAGLWPQMDDPRIKAVIAMAPDGDIWGADYGGVASMKLPVMVMTGSKDTANTPELTSYPIYEHLGSPMKTLVVFENEGHFLFPTPGEGSKENVELVKHFATAFLLSELKGDPEASKAMLAKNAEFPGVTFKTTVSNSQ